jgi:shikimate kinase
MGSGKSSIGQSLAALLGWGFVDLDEEIEHHEQLPVRQLFRERGESAFRAIEQETLRECLAGVSKPTILALGGGAFVQPNNVELLRTRGIRTVFLETPLEAMLARCGVEDEADPENSRPRAADAAAFRALYVQRLPSYRAAELTVETSGKTIEMVASEIAEKLRLVAIR